VLTADFEVHRGRIGKPGGLDQAASG